MTSRKLDVGRATFRQHIEDRQTVLDAEFNLLDAPLRLATARTDVLRGLAELGPPVQ